MKKQKLENGSYTIESYIDQELKRKNSKLNAFLTYNIPDEMKNSFIKIAEIGRPNSKIDPSGIIYLLLFGKYDQEDIQILLTFAHPDYFRVFGKYEIYS